MVSSIPKAGMQGACPAVSLFLAVCVHECGVLYLVWRAGGFEEASRRRKEAELSRAQLQQKIESLKQARSSAPRTGARLTRPAPPHQATLQSHCRALILQGLC